MPYPHKVVILRSGFRYADRSLIFGRARLFFDRIELSGWRVGQRHAVQIPLSSICDVEWLDDDDRRARARFHLRDGNSITLTLGRALHWRRRLAQRLSWTSRSDVPPYAADHTPTIGEVVAFASSFS